MTTYYVRETGSDNNNGLTEATALRNISTAVSIASPNDRINYLGTFSYCCTEFSSDTPASVSIGTDGSLGIPGGPSSGFPAVQIAPGVVVPV